ncbi:hypothetical protein [Thalassiella azotivora]
MSEQPGAERVTRPEQPPGQPDQGQPDHELEELEVDSRVPPRPEEEVADADRG